MFDVKMVAAKLREARIKKNMTQNNLADELGISFQAVSNWERGNSLPDISKYEDLCQILDIDLEYLLGISTDTQTVSKLLDRRKKEISVPITIKEIAPVIPLVPPNELKEVVEDSIDKADITIGEFSMMAPFLDEETINKLSENIAATNISELTSIAPFISQHHLDKMSENITATSISELTNIAPFVSQHCLDKMSENIAATNISELTSIAPFVSQHCLDKMSENIAATNISELTSIAPFVSQPHLDKMCECINPSKTSELLQIAPFLSPTVFANLVLKTQNYIKISFHELLEITPFLETQALEQIIENVEIGEKDTDRLLDIAPFLSNEAFGKLVRKTYCSTSV